MKTLGLIGGIGPESTIEYYRLLIERYRAKTNGDNPAIIINSIDLNRLIRWMNANELSRAADYVSQEIIRLHRAGADFAALCSNTPHIVFDELRSRSPIPLVSIVEAACARVQSLGLTTVGLFGTRYTMQARFYPEVFARAGINLVTPQSVDQDYIHDRYMNELLHNLFLPETAEKILAIADSMKSHQNVEAIILGGTELPLLLRADSHNSMPLLDTSSIHVDALVEHLLN